MRTGRVRLRMFFVSELLRLSCSQVRRSQSARSLTKFITELPANARSTYIFPLAAWRPARRPEKIQPAIDSPLT